MPRQRRTAPRINVSGVDLSAEAVSRRYPPRDDFPRSPPPHSGPIHAQSSNSDQDVSVHFTEGAESLDPRYLVVNHSLTLLWTSEDGRAGHYVFRAFDWDSAEELRYKYAFVGVRLVQFEDGLRAISWCSNPACPDHLSRQYLYMVYQNADFPTVPSSDHLGNLQPSCSCSDVVVRAETRNGELEPATLQNIWAACEGPKVSYQLPYSD